MRTTTIIQQVQKQWRVMILLYVSRLIETFINLPDKT